MKTKRIILNFVGLILSFNVTAQPPHWRATGTGNSGAGVDGVNGTNNMLGTPAGVDLRFGTNGGTERMRITSTGLVGLGLAAPTSMFHLQSNAASGGNLFRTDGVAANLNRWQLFTGGTEKFQVRIPGNSNNVIIQSSSAQPIVAGNQNGPGHLFFRAVG